MKRFDLSVFRKSFVTGLLALGLLASVTCLATVSAEESSVLQSMKTFEVSHFHSTYDLNTMSVPPELLTYLQTAIEAEPAIEGASPADALLELACRTRNCSKIGVHVRQNKKGGAVLWESEVKMYRLNLLSRFHSVEYKYQSVARRIVEKLTEAYTQMDMRAAN